MALTDNLGAYYKFDESSGNAADATGNGNTLTNNNTATYDAGKINNKVNLVIASTQYLEKSSPSNVVPSGDLTIAGWIRPTGLDSGHNRSSIMIIGTYVSAGTLIFTLELLGSDPSTITTLRFIQSNGTTLQFLDKAQSLSLNTYYHLAAVYTLSSGVVEFFIDGSSIGTVSGGNTSWGATTTPLTVGKTNAYYGGGIDELGIWTRALSSGEISSLYNSGSGLQYPFIQDISISVVDSITITEAVTMMEDCNINVSDTITITESVTITNTQLGDISVFDSITVTESISLDSPLEINVFDSVSISESVTVTNTQLGDINVNDSITITETVTATVYPDALNGIAYMRNTDDIYIYDMWGDDSYSPPGMDDKAII